METAWASLEEERIVLYDIAWETYESLLKNHLDRSVPHFTYYRGTLEIVRPSLEREVVNSGIALLVGCLAEELGIDVCGLGSTTFKREDLGCGFEPDSCFYIQNEQLIRGKDRIDPSIDPPPDLVIEIDITNPSLDKLPIYARFGVPEVWSYDGKNLRILTLESSEYAEVAESAALPPLTGTVLSGFVEKSKPMKRTAWLKTVREWARQHTGKLFIPRAGPGTRSPLAWPAA